jgi:hypothetical protein
MKEEAGSVTEKDEDEKLGKTEDGCCCCCWFCCCCCIGEAELSGTEKPELDDFVTELVLVLLLLLL